MRILPTTAATAQLRVVELSAQEWEVLVDRHSLGHLLQRRAWADLKSSVGQQARRLAVFGPEGCPLAGAQLLLRRQYGLSAAYVPRGPFWSASTAADELLLQAMERLARRHQAVFLRIEPDVLADDPGADRRHTWLLLQGWEPVPPIQPRSSVHLALDRSPDQIFADFSKGHRADIRRAERHKIQVRVGTEADLATFYAIMQTTAARAAFGIHTADYYRSAWRAAGNNCCLLLAEHSGQPVAAHMVFSDGRRACYLYGGAGEPGLKTGANHLLQWHAIQWAQACGCASYDFWGIPDALGRAAACDDAEQRAELEAAARSDPLIGVYRFKKGFGGRIVRYLPAYDRVFIAPAYRIWRRYYA